ncbi:MAG: ATP-grasp domain-containing protein [Acidiferrobacterales bacterium]|nr:ATP-grasp domain-containing protein [Acidiferrobacterales bacterium]
MNILLTGAGGSAAIAFLNATSQMNDINIFMADMDKHSTGLYLVPAERRAIVPAGNSKEFPEYVLSLCIENEIDVLIPTVDCELAPLASQRGKFEEAGVTLITSPTSTLRDCYDKYQLMQVLKDVVPLVPFQLLDDQTDIDSLSFPLIAKPRSGSGSRDIALIKTPADLNVIPRDGTFLLQGYLPGKEFSVDVFVNKSGKAIAKVVRERIKVDSGIAVISQTLVDEKISDMAAKIATHLGIRYVANVQLKMDEYGQPRLLEINPRFPGTMPLTVASGVNMPELCIREIRGETLPTDMEYKTIAMVRSWKETYLPASEFHNQLAAPAIGA